MADENSPVDTGLTGLVYEPPASLNVPAPITATVTPRIRIPHPDMSPVELAHLAREIAMDIKELPVILKTFNITQLQYDGLLTNPFYKAALDAAIIEWNSALSTTARIKIEAAATLEAALPSLGAKMQKKDESLDAQVKAGQLFAKLAGIGESGQGPTSGERFVININLGADTKIRYEKDVAPRGSGPLLELTKGTSNGSPPLPND